MGPIRREVEVWEHDDRMVERDCIGGTNRGTAGESHACEARSATDADGSGNGTRRLRSYIRVRWNARMGRNEMKVRKC